MIRIFPFLILFTFCFCSKREKKLPRLTSNEKSQAILIDSKIMLRSRVPLLAVNFINDTTVLKVEDMENFCNMKNVEVNDSLKTRPEDIQIFIDSSYNFSSQGFIYRNIPELTEQEKRQPIPNFSDPVDEEKYIFHRYLKQTDSLKQKYLKSYPVLIYNNSKSDLYFGMSPLLIIQEALDVDNKWKPIEYSYQMPGCGIAASIVSYRVQPKHYLATATIKYTGNFKTKIRVNYLRGRNVIQSNEIIGYINRSQFDTKHIEDLVSKIYDKNNFKAIKTELGYMLHKPLKN